MEQDRGENWKGIAAFAQAAAVLGQCLWCLELHPTAAVAAAAAVAGSVVRSGLLPRVQPSEVGLAAAGFHHLPLAAAAAAGVAAAATAETHHFHLPRAAVAALAAHHLSLAAAEAIRHHVCWDGCN